MYKLSLLARVIPPIININEMMLLGFIVSKIERDKDNIIIYTDSFILKLKEKQLNKYKITDSVIMSETKIRREKLLLIKCNNSSWSLKIIDRNGAYFKAYDVANDEVIEIMTMPMHKSANIILT